MPHSIRRHPVARSAPLGLGLLLTLIAAACTSATEPPTASSSEALTFPLPVYHPWSFGLSGNEAAATAANANDLQFFCASATSPTTIANFVFDTAPPYNDFFTANPVSGAEPILGTNVSAIPGAVANLVGGASGPQSLTAFWIDRYHEVTTADQLHGKWQAPKVIAGVVEGSGGVTVTTGAFAATASRVAGIQVNGSTQLAFWVAEDGSVWESVRLASWGAPVEVAPAGSAAGPIDAMSKASTHADVVWITPSGTLVDAWWDASANSTFTFATSPITGASGASPSGGIAEVVGGPAAGDLSVLWITTGGAVMQSVNDAARNSWLAPVTVASRVVESISGGRIQIGPAAAADSGLGAVTTASLGGAAGGRVQVAWVTPRGQLATACSDPAGSCYGSADGAWGVALPSVPGTLSHDPIAIASRSPGLADILYVDTAGDLYDASWTSSAPAVWTPSWISAGGCMPCGASGQPACNGDPASCPSGNVLVASGLCEPCGELDEPVCSGTACTQAGTVVETQSTPAECVCDPNDYQVAMTAEIFNVYVAPQLNAGFGVQITNDEMTITVPSGLGISAPPQTTVSGGSAWITDLTMPAPGNPLPNWVWSMSADSNAITITTTISATLGIDGPSCGATVYVVDAPVTINLGPGTLGVGNLPLQVESLSIGFDSSPPGSNIAVSGCSLVAGSIESQVESGLPQQLTTQFNSFLSGNPGILTSILQTLARTGEPLDPTEPILTTLPTPLPSAQTFSWQCSPQSMTEGAVNGVCWRVCANP